MDKIIDKYIKEYFNTTENKSSIIWNGNYNILIDSDIWYQLENNVEEYYQFLNKKYLELVVLEYNFNNIISFLPENYIIRVNENYWNSSFHDPDYYKTYHIYIDIEELINYNFFNQYININGIFHYSLNYQTIDNIPDNFKRLSELEISKIISDRFKLSRKYTGE